MIDTRNVFDQPIKNYIKTHEDTREIATGQRDESTSCITSCLLDHLYFKENKQLTAIDKQATSKEAN